MSGDNHPSIQDLLVAIEGKEEAAGTPVRRDRWVAPEIALRGLDLDDLSSEIGEHLRAVGAGDDLAELQNPNALQGIRLIRAHLSVLIQ